MRLGVGIAGAVVGAVIACSSGAPKYPACQTDEQCAVGGHHDYCVAGRCAYCRTSVDCGDRERCRSGACEPDPDAPPVPEAGADAEANDAGAEEPGEGEEPSEDDTTETRRQQVRVRELERRVRQLRRRPHP